MQCVRDSPFITPVLQSFPFSFPSPISVRCHVYFVCFFLEKYCIFCFLCVFFFRRIEEQQSMRNLSAVVDFACGQSTLPKTSKHSSRCFFPFSSFYSISAFSFPFLDIRFHFIYLNSTEADGLTSKTLITKCIIYCAKCSDTVQKVQFQKFNQNAEMVNSRLSDTFMDFSKYIVKLI